jgi:hypothetical protein
VNKKFGRMLELERKYDADQRTQVLPRPLCVMTASAQRSWLANLESRCLVWRCEPLRPVRGFAQR